MSGYKKFLILQLITLLSDINSLILQYGRQSGFSGDILLPQAYTTSYEVLLTAHSGISSMNLITTVKTLTQFTISAWSTGGGVEYSSWITIGY